MGIWAICQPLNVAAGRRLPIQIWSVASSTRRRENNSTAIGCPHRAKSRSIKGHLIQNVSHPVVYPNVHISAAGIPDVDRKFATVRREPWAAPIGSHRLHGCGLVVAAQ